MLKATTMLDMYLHLISDESALNEVVNDTDTRDMCLSQLSQCNKLKTFLLCGKSK